MHVCFKRKKLLHAKVFLGVFCKFVIGMVARRGLESHGDEVDLFYKNVTENKTCVQSQLPLELHTG